MTDNSPKAFVRFSVTAAVGAAIIGAALWLPLMALSLHLHGKIAVRAADWQKRERGIVTLPATSEVEFKHLRLAQKATDIRVLVLGSSRVMDFGSDALGPDSYNLSTSSNNAAVMLTQARIALNTAPNLRTIYFAVDWAIGDIFYPFPILPITFPDLPPMSFSRIASAARESFTLRRLLMLHEILGDNLISGNGGFAIKDLLLTGITTRGSCPGGVKFALFSLVPTVQCFGFREDGSHAFEALPGLRPEAAKLGVQRSVERGSHYVQALASTEGNPNQSYLSELSRVAYELRERGGNLVAVIPPLLPGVEQGILERADSSIHLRKYKERIASWARQENVQVIDLGASERFGCDLSDFIDAHHAKAGCFVKAMTAKLSHTESSVIQMQ